MCVTVKSSESRCVCACVCTVGWDGVHAGAHVLMLRFLNGSQCLCDKRWCVCVCVTYFHFHKEIQSEIRAVVASEDKSLIMFLMIYLTEM